MTTGIHTLTVDGLPWERPTERSSARVPHLVACWSLDEPERVGEVAPLGAAAVLGRGDAQPDDLAARLIWYQPRPDGTHAQPPLASRRISRSQLHLEPTPEGNVAVRQLGRCPLVVRGKRVERAVVAPGETFSLDSTALYLVVARSLEVPASRAPSARFAFGQADPDGIVGESPGIWALREQVALAAAGPHHVLVTGESGSGKELVARALHAHSSRRSAPFVARNAATFPEGLIDAELFGSARGYPNAGSPERPGVVGEADRGTLFLDEIGELPQTLQAHLLRLLDRGGEYQRLGESRVRRADLRVVAATNRAATALKHDLAARFATRISTLTLGERLSDLPLLIRFLLRRLATSGSAIERRFVDSNGEARVQPELIERLLSVPYTTHLRQLERLLWVAVESSTGSYVELTPEVIALAAETPASEAPDAAPSSALSGEDSASVECEAEVAWNEVSEDAIRDALAQSGGNVSDAARRLKLKNRYVLIRLLKKYGIEQAPEHG